MQTAAGFRLLLAGTRSPAGLEQMEQPQIPLQAREGTNPLEDKSVGKAGGSSTFYLFLPPLANPAAPSIPRGITALPRAEEAPGVWVPSGDPVWGQADIQVTESKALHALCREVQQLVSLCGKPHLVSS